MKTDHATATRLTQLFLYHAAVSRPSWAQRTFKTTQFRVNRRIERQVAETIKEWAQSSSSLTDTFCGVANALGHFRLVEIAQAALRDSNLLELAAADMALSASEAARILLDQDAAFGALIQQDLDANPAGWNPANPQE